MIELPKGDIEALKTFLEANSCYLHPNHYLLTEIRLALIQTLGQGENGMENVSNEDLEVKLKTCAHLSSLFGILTPGEFFNNTFLQIVSILLLAYSNLT